MCVEPACIRISTGENVQMLLKTIRQTRRYEQTSKKIFLRFSVLSLAQSVCEIDRNDQLMQGTIIWWLGSTRGARVYSRSRNKFLFSAALCNTSRQGSNLASPSGLCETSTMDSCLCEVLDTARCFAALSAWALRRPRRLAKTCELSSFSLDATRTGGLSNGR